MNFKLIIASATTCLNKGDELHTRREASGNGHNIKALSGVGKYQSYLLLASTIRNLPGHLGIALRSIFYRSVLESCGEDLTILEGVYVDGPQMISIGNRVRISRYCCLQGGFGVDIGDDVLIGPYSFLESVHHIYARKDLPIASQGFEGGKIVVEQGSWIGAHAVILPGVRLGRGCIIGAGAVVTKDVSPFGIVAGVPAKMIGQR